MVIVAKRSKSKYNKLIKNEKYLLSDNYFLHDRLKMFNRKGEKKLRKELSYSKLNYVTESELSKIVFDLGIKAHKVLLKNGIRRVVNNL